MCPWLSVLAADCLNYQIFCFCSSRCVFQKYFLLFVPNRGAVWCPSKVCFQPNCGRTAGADLQHWFLCLNATLSLSYICIFAAARKKKNENLWLKAWLLRLTEMKLTGYLSVSLSKNRHMLVSPFLALSPEFSLHFTLYPLFRSLTDNRH